MLSGTTPEKIIDYVRLSVYLSCCWPLPATASKSQVIGFKLQYIGCVLNSTTLICGLIYAMYLHLDDTGIIVRSSCLVIAIAQVIMQPLLAMTQYERLRRLIAEMEDYCKRAEKYERDILQQYIDNCSTFYGVCMAWFYSSAAAFIAGTLLTSQQFPTEAEYPFAVSYQPMKTIIYLHQSLVGVQCGAQICVNVFIALLLWFAAARFEILSMELEAITDMQKLVMCVQRYHQAKRYAMETTVAVRYLIVITIGMSAAALLCASITFVGKQPLPIKVQFLLLSATALMEVFMCAWPADHLKNMSVDVVQGAYKSVWYERTSEIKKDILFILLPKKPVTLSVTFIMPTLSLNYYCTYLSNAYTAFAALRVML